MSNSNNNKSSDSSKSSNNNNSRYTYGNDGTDSIYSHPLFDDVGGVGGGGDGSTNNNDDGPSATNNNVTDLAAPGFYPANKGQQLQPFVVEYELRFPNENDNSIRRISRCGGGVDSYQVLENGRYYATASANRVGDVDGGGCRDGTDEIQVHFPVRNDNGVSDYHRRRISFYHGGFENDIYLHQQDNDTPAGAAAAGGGGRGRGRGGLAAITQREDGGGGGGVPTTIASNNNNDNNTTHTATTYSSVGSFSVIGAAMTAATAAAAAGTASSTAVGGADAAAAEAAATAADGVGGGAETATASTSAPNDTSNRHGSSVRKTNNEFDRAPFEESSLETANAPSFGINHHHQQQQQQHHQDSAHTRSSLETSNSMSNSVRKNHTQDNVQRSDSNSTHTNRSYYSYGSHNAYNSHCGNCSTYLSTLGEASAFSGGRSYGSGDDDVYTSHPCFDYSSPDEPPSPPGPPPIQEFVAATTTTRTTRTTTTATMMRMNLPQPRPLPHGAFAGTTATAATVMSSPPFVVPGSIYIPPTENGLNDNLSPPSMAEDREYPTSSSPSSAASISQQTSHTGSSSTSSSGRGRYSVGRHISVGYFSSAYTSSSSSSSGSMRSFRSQHRSNNRFVGGNPYRRRVLPIAEGDTSSDHGSSTGSSDDSGGRRSTHLSGGDELSMADIEQPSTPNNENESSTTSTRRQMETTPNHRQRQRERQRLQRNEQEQEPLVSEVGKEDLEAGKGDSESGKYRQGTTKDGNLAINNHVDPWWYRVPSSIRQSTRRMTSCPRPTNWTRRTKTKLFLCVSIVVLTILLFLLLLPIDNGRSSLSSTPCQCQQNNITIKCLGDDDSGHSRSGTDNTPMHCILHEYPGNVMALSPSVSSSSCIVHTIEDNGVVVAVGEPALASSEDDAENRQRFGGRVGVHQLDPNGLNWVPMGGNIFSSSRVGVGREDEGGSAKDDYFGSTVALSRYNGTTLAVSAVGVVYVSTWVQIDGSLGFWNPLGNDIMSPWNNTSFGHSLSLSADGTILAIGSSPYSSTIPTSKGLVAIADFETETTAVDEEDTVVSGYVQVYRLVDGNAWEPMGGTIISPLVPISVANRRRLQGSSSSSRLTYCDGFAMSLSLSDDGNELTVNDPIRGSIHSYKYRQDTSEWITSTSCC